MLPALALCLVSLIASPASAASGSDIDVKVVDTAGRPVAGVQVVVDGIPDGSKLRVDRAVSDAHGIARISGALDVIREDTAHRYSVRAIVFSARDVRADLGPAQLGGGHATLVLPALGSVVFRLPAEAQQVCRVRLFALGASEPGAMRERLFSTMQELEARNGSARCDRVGLGLELEYEIRGLGSSDPWVGRVVGPTRFGEVVKVEVPAQPPELRVLARLVDEDGKPLAHASIEWRWQPTTEFPGQGGCEILRGLLASDDQGRVALPIQGARREASRPGVRLPGLTLGLALSCPPERRFSSDKVSVRVRVPAFQPGQDRDLGELRLTRYGSALRYRDLDDQTLEQGFLHFEDARFLETGGDVHTEMLCEMVRRGSKRFERFVSDVLQGLADHDRVMCEVNRLFLLTALNRLQGRPDPLTIRWNGPEEVELELPGSSEFAFEIENSAPENGPLLLPASGKWPRPAIEIHDDHGQNIPQPICGTLSEPGSWSPLAPGESRELRVQSERLLLPGPGDYRVRVHCSPTLDVVQLGLLDGRIYFSSAEFTLHVRARSAR